jgi:uncharacterized repeat protein (TIGR01451 family)/fimbrial isopeptide formation D2 family protein
MTPSQLRLNPFRAVPVAFALIFNVVFGPLAPAAQTLLSGPQTALAYVGDSTTFELDGNAYHAGSSHDWDQVYADRNGPPFSNSDANNVVFATDTVGAGDDILTGGSTKDTIDISSWLWNQTSSTSVQDKDDIENAFAAAYTATNGHTVGYFGLDRYSISGDATAGFWFFKNDIGKTNTASQGGFQFSGQHAEGDILVVIDFVNGGSQGEATVYYWHNNALVLKTTGGECDGSNQEACAITNIQDENSPWSYTPKSGTAGVFPAAPIKQNGSQGAGAFYEGGIDLTALGLDTGCFSSFMAETRSSQEPTSTLSDFVLGNFSFCAPPTIETQVSDSSVSVGDSVTDLATLSGDKGTVEGTVDFYLCGPDSSAPDCKTGGTKVGATKTLSGGTATSDAYTANAAGWYCFRAAYTPAEGSKYLEASHTNQDSECFQVKPAEVHVTKTADAPSVTAGDPIGFTVTVSNTGTGTAKGVELSDALPGGNSGHYVDWTIDTSKFDHASFSLTGADGSQQLALAGQPITLAPGASLKVHITAATDKTSCAEYDNTASVSSSNDGSDDDSASTEVLCPSVHVTKTADAASVSAGEQIGFHVTISNTGDGEARGLSVSDALPGGTGIDWSIESSDAGWSITGSAPNQSLAYAGTTLAAGASSTVHVVSDTTKDSCKEYDNTASISATNDGSDEDSASTEVLCPSIHVTKTADAASVSAGSDIGFTVTVSNTGAGDAKGVSLSDSLPGGNGGTPVHWVIDGSTGDPASFAISGLDGSQTLALAGQPITLASGASLTVHIKAATDQTNCAEYDNSASVSTSNDGSDEDSASTKVLCPALSIEKTADASPVNAGDDIGFTITVSNSSDPGTGTATKVTLNDPLPAGVTWSIDPTYAGPGTCSIDGSQTLTCSFGDMAPGDSASVHVSATTSAQACATYPNTAKAQADNHDQIQASATIECLKPDIHVTKTADAASVTAGDPIGFTVTISNSGAGTAYNVHLDDALPGGNAGTPVTWSIDTSQFDYAAFQITGAAGSQSLSLKNPPVSMASGASLKVHITASTTKASCASYLNDASVTTSNDGSDEDSASTVVECPGLNIAKTAADTSINGGESASFTITVWNTGPGTAYNVTLNDPLPGGLAWTDDSNDCSISSGTLSCNFGDLGVTTMENSPATVTVTAPTTREDCGTLDNLATASADNNDDVTAEASIDVTCPVIRIQKVNDTTAPVLPGTTVTYTLTVTVQDGPALNAKVVDTLPAGLDDPTNISDGGTWSSADRTITWQFASLDGMKVLTYKAAVSADDTQGQVLENVAVVTSPNTQCPDAESVGEECTDVSDVTVRVPTLVIDKAASIDEVHFVFNADGSLKSVTPADRQVTWTLTYTLTNGPVTDAVICDPLPDYLTFVSASDGGAIADGTGGCKAGEVEWDLGTLSASGSVTVVTTVNEDAPDGLIDNVATISSNETPSDTGEDSIRVTSEQVEAATPTPSASVPNTALVLSQNGEPIQVPVELLVLVLLSSLGVLTLVNVKAVRRRR